MGLVERARKKKSEKNEEINSFKKKLNFCFFSDK